MAQTKLNKKGIALIAVVILLIAAVYYVMTSGMLLSGEKKDQFLNDRLIKEVGALMALPEGTPAIFEVKDPDAIKQQQPFFAGVVTGDKLLVYTAQAKAIIYSPSRKMIINAGPINFDQANGQAPVGTEQTNTPAAPASPVAN